MNISKGDKTYLGKTVTVHIDRKIGTPHPKHPDIIYPVNYGYVQGLVAGDGEEQDVYVLGINEPQDICECVIVAVIFRENDNEDKWVGIPKALVGTEICYECNIVHATHFQEQFYKIKVFPLYEKTCGAVIYTDTEESRRYFLVKSRHGHVCFPKGHVEYGESEHDSALREVFEETGLNVILSDNFREEYTFRTLDDTEKTSVFFVGKFESTDTVKIQQEEVTADWLIDYETAMRILNWEQDKEILRKAEEYLNRC